MPDLSDLISRVEKASGPDHQLDKMIFAAIRGWSYPLVGSALMEFENETRIHGRTNYTTSIDAALTLLPEGMSAKLWIHGDESYADVYRIGPYLDGDRKVVFGPFDGQAATAPLALLAAILRARQGAQSGQAQTEARDD